MEDGLIDALGRALQRSLRSDWDRFIRGEDYVERTMALSALAASGRYDPAYFAELSRETKWQDTEGVSEVLLAGVLGGQAPKVVLDGISQTLLERVTVRLFNGVEVYAGLKAGRTDRSGLILPSEVRTLAGMIRALAAADQQNPRLDMLYKALISLGQGGGWGSSNADTEAILALADRLQNNKDHGGASITLRGGGLPGTLALEEQSIARALAKDGSAITITAADGLILRADTRYMPAEDGSKAEAKGQGFVVQRELWRIDPKGGAAEKYPLEAAGRTLAWTLGDVMEDRVQVINPEERHHVVITVPLAAGVELLNPDLASSPPEARPSSGPSLTPDYAMLLDDRIQYFYDTLPKGSYTFAFRVRATTVGSFVQPSAQAAMIYQAGVRGQSPGARVTVAARP